MAPGSVTWGQIGRQADLYGFFGALDVLPVSEEADPLNLLTQFEIATRTAGALRRAARHGQPHGARAGKGECEMVEKRSVVRRSGAERRTSERRSPASHRRLAAGPGPPPRTRERRKGLRRLQ